MNGRPLIDRCRISKLRDGSMPRIAPTSVVAGKYWLALRRYLGVPMAPAAPPDSMVLLELPWTARTACMSVTVITRSSARSLRQLWSRPWQGGGQLWDCRWNGQRRALYEPGKHRRRQLRHLYVA